MEQNVLLNKLPYCKKEIGRVIPQNDAFIIEIDGKQEGTAGKNLTKLPKQLFVNGI